MTSRFQSTCWVSFSLLVLLILSLTEFSNAQEKAGESRDRHLGTWKLVSTRYGNAKDFTKYTGESLRLKLINPTHFTWVEVSPEKKVLSSAGGRYTLEGNVYTEMIEFGGDGMEGFFGKAQKFTIKVEGDKFFQSGELSNGLKIEENWERVK